MTRLVTASLILLSLSACTKEEVVEETADSTLEEPPSWSEMSDTQKSSYMANEVTPAMAAIFKAYDPEEYADFSCATCHGSDAEANGFQMPSDIHELSVPPPEVYAGPAVEFMYTEVVPAMAGLLDMDVNDGTNDGFGCYGCHTPEQ